MVRFHSEPTPNPPGYIEKGSTHSRSCYRAIMSGVFKRLGRLTSKDNSKITMSTIDDLYPDHVYALKK